MTSRFRFLGGYFLFWLVGFLLLKALFLLYNAKLATDLSLNLVPLIFLHGFKLDLSMSSYLCLLPFLLVAFSGVLSKRVVGAAIKVYTYLAVVLVLFLSISDLEFFQGFGYRLDDTPLNYSNTPRDIWAAIAGAPLGFMIAMFIGFSLLGGYIYAKRLHPQTTSWPTMPWFYGLFFLLLIGATVIPIRGGLRTIPLQQSDAYFSHSDFANQAALNVVWNAFYALQHRPRVKKNPYLFMESAQAQAIFHSSHPQNTPANTSLLSNNRPNIILIVWEGLSYSYISGLGGTAGATPELDRLIPEGILFTNFYANADRTDKGLVALLSGSPVLPRHSIVKFPNKAARLPSLARVLDADGYATSFCYGGDLNFANFKSYLTNTRFRKFIAEEDFARKYRHSKWGVHDQVLMPRVLSELDQEKTPFFATIFTLSSHEPFEVPWRSQFTGNDYDSRFFNALNYADKAVGDFIATARLKPWFQNSLIIIVADHGRGYPGNFDRCDPRKYHIPMLWLGGALKNQATKIATVGAQMDLAATLLAQLGRETKDFPWSKNMFSAATSGSAFYVFNDGFGYVDARGRLAFNNSTRRLFFRDPALSERELRIGQAMLQLSFQEFLEQ